MVAEKPIGWDEGITVGEAAKILGVSRGRVHQFIKGRRLLASMWKGEYRLLEQQVRERALGATSKGRPLTLEEWEKQRLIQKPKDQDYGKKALWLTTAQAAERMGKNAVYVAQLCAKGRLVARRVALGGIAQGWEVSEESVLNYKPQKRGRKPVPRVEKPVEEMTHREKEMAIAREQQRRFMAQHGYASEQEQIQAVKQQEIAEETRRNREWAERIKSIIEEFDAEKAATARISTVSDGGGDGTA